MTGVEVVDAHGEGQVEAGQLFGQEHLVVVDVLVVGRLPRHQQRVLAGLEGGQRGAAAAVADHHVGMADRGVQLVGGDQRAGVDGSPVVSVQPVCHSTSASAGTISTRRSSRRRNPKSAIVPSVTTTRRTGGSASAEEAARGW